MTKKRPYAQRGEQLRAMRGKTTASDFARELGVNLTTYYRYERGDTQIPDGLLKLAKIISSSKQFDKISVSDPESGYVPHGGWRPHSIEEMTVVPRGLGMGQAVEMLANIYQSGNREIIHAIQATLHVCCVAVQQAARIDQLTRDMDDLRRLFREHAKLHAYHGEDRRSGVDRRQVEGVGPDGIERRSGVDRRQAHADNGG